jgi:hypothetical protein
MRFCNSGEFALGQTIVLYFRSPSKLHQLYQLASSMTSTVGSIEIILRKTQRYRLGATERLIGEQCKFHLQLKRLEATGAIMTDIDPSLSSSSTSRRRYGPLRYFPPGAWYRLSHLRQCLMGTRPRGSVQCRRSRRRGFHSQRLFPTPVQCSTP